MCCGYGGGQDWQRLLEDALRNKARKVLFVGTRQGAQKRGVRNEIQIAHDVGRRIGDSEFVIPLRLNRFDAPFLIAHAQHINFERSWAAGLAELLDTLEDTYHVPRATDRISDSVRHWRAVQLRHAKNVSSGNDLVISNWLRLTGIPESLTFYDFRAGISINAAKQKMETAEWPLVPLPSRILVVRWPTRVGGTLRRGVAIVLCKHDQYGDFFTGRLERKTN